MRLIGILALIFLFACGGKKEESAPAIYYQYGTAALPGAVAPLAADYRPRGLSEKIFTTNGKTYAPADILTQELELSFDVLTQSTSGRSTVSFALGQNSYPYLDLDAVVTRAELDGVDVTTVIVSDPEGVGENFLSLDNFTASGTHTLVLEYDLPGRINFANGGVDFITSMRDVSSVRFFERWGPSGFEEDSFELNLKLKVLNGSSSHQLFSNGTITNISANEWELDFPAYFTKSSFYVHLTNESFEVRNFFHHGIPVTVYSSGSLLADKAVSLLPDLFEELENDYGPYPHQIFTAYIQAGGGGMEYSGATISSLSALDHELLHSWFARGVMPADGRSGWIDEAIASWRDYGYFQASTLLSRGATNLSDYSPYRMSTPSNCYSDGRQLLSELDRVFAPYGGLRPVLRLFSDQYQHKVVTNDEFWMFLESLTMMDLDPYFNRYTLGR